MGSGALQKRSEKYVRSLLRSNPPRRLSQNFRDIDGRSCDRLKQSLINNFFTKEGAVREEYLSMAAGKSDLLEHLYRRLGYYRHVIVPWLDHFKAINKASILEIGCGTGALTVALAEQAADVTAVDLDKNSLTVAKERCEIYGLEAKFIEANAIDVKALLPRAHFDFIIFPASLEHMTHEERIITMRDTWNMLDKDDFWCILNAPNRLWYHDGYTSFLPFFLWLPDDLALEYFRFSPRTELSRLHTDIIYTSKRDFLRLGRGISFHEFELAIAPIKELNIVSDLFSYRRKRNIFVWLQWKKNDSRYSAFLSKVHPAASKGFNERSLDIIIKKGRDRGRT
jgi:2-polyprenyl-3-methyl-5-hydroxy-6-metoxy-1,4-benzoquinol methylase